MAQMKKCGACGAPNPATASACYNCRSSLTAVLPQPIGVGSGWRKQLSDLWQWIRQRMAANKQARAAHQAYLVSYNRDTHMGTCPQCGSRNLQQLRVGAGGGSHDAQYVACCLGCCLLWPLILLAPFLGQGSKVETHRRCRACGYQWRL